MIMSSKRIRRLILLLLGLHAVRGAEVYLESKGKVGKCLKAAGEGTMVKLADCVDGKTNQQWIMDDTSGSQLRSKDHRDQCVAMGMLLKPCKAKDEAEKQMWQFVENKGLIRNTFSGLCMNPFEGDMVSTCAVADDDEVKWTLRDVDTKTNGGDDDKDQKPPEEDAGDDKDDKDEDDGEPATTLTAYQIDLNGEGKLCLTTGFFGLKGKIKVKPCDKNNIKAHWLLDNYSKTIRPAAKPHLCIEVSKIVDGKSLRLNTCRDKKKKKQQWNWRLTGFGGSDPIRSDLRRDMCIYHTGSGSVKLGFAATHCVLPMSKMQWAFNEIEVDADIKPVPEEPEEPKDPTNPTPEKTFKDCSWQKIESPKPQRRFGHHAHINGDAMVVTYLGRPVDEVYVYRRNSNGKWRFDQTIRADDIEVGDGYGFQYADISLNGKYIAITAKSADSGGMEDNGAVLIFERDGDGEYKRVAHLKGEEEGDLFGNNIALEGDTLLIGARRAKNDRGVVYAYRRTGPERWELYDKLVPADVSKGDQFGRRTNFRGQTAVIAALNSANNKDAEANEKDANLGTGGTAFGVYIFDDDRGNGTNQGRGFSETQKLLPEDPEDIETFGFKVDIDHFSDTVIIGAKRKNGKGVVYVFTRKSNGRWVQSAKLKPDSYDSDYLFGADVAVENGIILVDALSEKGSGLVYVFTGHGSDWKQQHVLSKEDGFGDSLDIHKTTAAIGAPGEDNDSGAVYMVDFCEE